jgi:phage terminase large subunit-like protein
LFDALETGMGAHENPLSIIIISTQAPTDADLLSTLIDGAEAANDPTIKVFKWAAGPDDDPWSEETWHQANPGLAHGLPNLDELRRTAEQAKRLPALEASFKNLHLNIPAGSDRARPGGAGQCRRSACPAALLCAATGAARAS